VLASAPSVCVALHLDRRRNFVNFDSVIRGQSVQQDGRLAGEKPVPVLPWR
jgi:hypothetical protein